MELSKTLASQIVIAVHEVVKNDINLINSSGIIIGSTETKRIGNFHEAGYRAISLGTPIIVDSNHAFEGAKEGINYPIFLELVPIAAIGISGVPSNVEQFGFLVTKITEVFLKEQQLNEELLSENRSLHYLITSLLHDDIRNQKQLDLLLEKYHLQPTDQYCVLTAKLNDTTIEQSLRYYFSNINCQLFLYLYPNEWVVIFEQNNYKQFDEDDFVSRFHNKLTAGLGSFGTLYQLGISYQNAIIARNHARKQNLTFCSSDHISIEFIIENLSAEVRALYAAQILKNLSDKDFQTLDAYFSRNMSLKDTADALYIHKNTLQYQLDKITERCCLNPRHFQDAFILQFALLCDTKQ